MKNTTVTIKGLHCNSCKVLIENECKNIKGLKSCHVDFQTGKTLLEHDENFDFNFFKKEIESLGQYKIEIN